jgi:hypothetical protein
VSADHPQEDITCVLYDTFDFIEAARKGSSATDATSKQQQQQQQHVGSRVPPLPLQQQQQQQQQRYLQQQQQQLIGGCGGGRVLVHCSQGVSRSTTIAIAYLMWKTGGSYDDVYQAVRALRGVTSPNVGFMCQLINWAVSRQLFLWFRLSMSGTVSNQEKPRSACKCREQCTGFCIETGHSGGSCE